MNTQNNYTIVASALFLFISSTILSEQQNYDYLKPKIQYQDIIINNVVVSNGVRECASRYQALKPLLEKYKRPFTVLDIGASQGYFALRIAHDFPQSTCVMIEGNYKEGSSDRIADSLLEICILNTNLNNIIFLKKCVSAHDLKSLSQCEHFDVVLAFNVVHHTGNEWQQWLDAIFNLGDNIVIETPPGAESVYPQYQNLLGAIEDHLINKGDGQVLCETPRHTNPIFKAKTFLFEQNKSTIDRIHMLTTNHPTKKLMLKSSYEHKYLIKTLQRPKVSVSPWAPNSIRITPWHPGINLITFKMLNGAYPTTDMLKKALIEQNKVPNDEPFAWNIIVQGNRIAYIDWDVSGDRKFDPIKAQLHTLAFLYLSKPEDIKNYYHAFKPDNYVLINRKK